jgi:hypothetical protein
VKGRAAAIKDVKLCSIALGPYRVSSKAEGCVNKTEYLLIHHGISTCQQHRRDNSPRMTVTDSYKCLSAMIRDSREM